MVLHKKKIYIQEIIKLMMSKMLVDSNKKNMQRKKLIQGLYQSFNLQFFSNVDKKHVDKIIQFFSVLHIILSLLSIV